MKGFVEKLLANVDNPQKILYHSVLLRAMYVLVDHYYDETDKKFTCYNQILKDTKRILKIDTWNISWGGDIPGVIPGPVIRHYIEALLGDRTNGLAKRLFSSKKLWSDTFSLLTFASIGQVPGIIVKSASICQTMHHKIQSSYQLRSDIQDVSKKCGDGYTIEISGDPDQAQFKFTCDKFGQLIGLLDSIGGTVSDYSKIMFLISLREFLDDSSFTVDLADSNHLLKDIFFYNETANGVLFVLSDLYRHQAIQTNVSASQLVKDVFNMISSNMTGGEVQSIPIKLTSPVSLEIITKIRDTYGYNIHIDTTGVYDRVYFHMLHMIHHDTGKELKGLFDSFSRLEFEDTNTATRELIGFIANKVCALPVKSCFDTRQKRMIEARVLEGLGSGDLRQGEHNNISTLIANAAAAADGNGMGGGGGQSNNAMTSVLLMAVLFASSVAGSLRW